MSITDSLTVGVGGVLFSRGGEQVLIVVENSSNLKYGKRAGMLSIPLGRINGSSEAERRAIEREVLEEAGCEVEVKTYLGEVYIPGAIAHLFLLEMIRGGENFASGRLKPRWMNIDEIMNLPNWAVRPPTKAAIQLALCWYEKSRDDS